MNMAIKLIPLAFIACLLHVSAFARGPRSDVETLCQFDDEWVKATVSHLEYLKKVLPIIPSEELTYIKQQEMRKVLPPDREEQIAKIEQGLSQRPYYSVYRVNWALDGVIWSFAGILSPGDTDIAYKDNPELVKAYKAALTLREVNGFQFAMEHFSPENKSFLRSHGMRDKDISSLGEYATEVYLSMPSYIACKLARPAALPSSEHRPLLPNQ